MKIVILFGSPNRSGSTSILTDEFTRGAEEKGHQVERIDICHADIHPCIGCVRCGYEGPCVQKDVVELIRQKLGFDSLRFQKLEDLLAAIEVEPCKLCTYCWNGKG